MSNATMSNTKKISALLGFITLGSLNPALADSESPSFSNSTGVLTLPNVIVDSSVWYSDVELGLNFATGEFSLLSAFDGDESSFGIRLSALEDLVVDAVTPDEEQDISTRLSALEQVITSPISIEGSTLRQRISALESVLSPPTITTNLSPGRYTDPSDWCYDLTGPFVYDDARVTYFIQSCDNATTFVAELLSGPLESHPQMGDRLAELTLPGNRVYGLATARTNTAQSPVWFWSENRIIGARQSGNILTLDLYWNGGDSEVAADTVTLTKSTEE